jgi:methyl-accepting chemotaxis protein
MSLVIPTLIVVIIPSILSVFIRRCLYQDLQNLNKKTRRLVDNQSEGIQPRFINLLQQRFTKASEKLENVNTIAIIDGIYHQETFTIFNFKIRHEQGEYITKTLPNLLLAFGLLGTFLGITLNLNSISQIINTGGTNIVDLTSQLQQPLQSMGIAFITSLIGLFCSSILTIINLRYNISLEKNSLLNNLEDYLDNIYKVKIKGYSRLDEAVNKMVDKQTEFLTRFHENVGQVLERTFKEAADKIADGNEKSQQLASQVYQSLLDASGAINTGANIFKESTTNLDNQVQSIQRMMPIFRSNIESFDKSSNLILTASSKIEASKFSENIEKITVDLAQTQSKFTKATQLLANCTLTMTNNNEKATNLAQKVYEELKNASESLEESSVLFADSATTIKDSQFNQNLVKATANLDTIQQQFLEMVNTLSDVIKPIEINVKTLDLSIDKMVKVTPDYQKFSTAIETLEESAVIFGQSAIMIKESKFDENLVNTAANLATIQQQFLQIVNTLSDVIKPIEMNVKTLDSSIDKMVKVIPDYQKFSTSIDKLEESAIIFGKSAITIKDSKFNDHLVNATNNLSIIQQQFLQMIKTLNEIVKPIAINVKTLELSTDKMVKLSQNVDNINSSINHINSRYLEMSNISREILLKLGELSVNNKNNSSQFTENIIKVTKDLQEKFRSLDNHEKQFLDLYKQLVNQLKQINENINNNPLKSIKNPLPSDVINTRLKQLEKEIEDSTYNPFKKL